MKKNILVIILLIITLSVTGCDNKLSNDINIDLAKGSVTSICKKKQKSEEYTSDIKTISNYDSNNDIINMKIETLYKFNDNDKFDVYVNEAKNTSDNMVGDDILYKYVYDVKKKELLTVIAYTKFTLINEVKPVYNAPTHIKTLEENGEKCEVIGKTRAELGI